MDFTYIVGGALAVVIGFVTKVVFLVLRRSDDRLLAVAFSVALAANLLLLINWRELLHAPVLILVVDAVAIPIATILGVVIGILPPLVLSGVWRRLTARSAGQPDPKA